MNAETQTKDLPPIVLIHGLWMTPRSWEKWIERYSARGHQVIAPAWPGLEVEVESLRQDSSPIAKLGVPAILDSYERVIRSLDKPPIIIGHSFGGAFTQILLSRGLGRAGVGLAAGTVKGVYRLPFSTIRSAGPLLLNPLARHKAIPFTAEQFNYAFTNNLSTHESMPLYERYAIPGSRNVLLTGANANFNPATVMKVDFKKNDRAPLLFIAGGIDHVVPPAVNRENWGRYKDSMAITAYKEFPGRTHFTAGQSGWEEVADYALSWAMNPMASAP